MSNVRPELARPAYSWAVSLLTAVLAGIVVLSCAEPVAQLRYPGEHWEKASTPEVLGWSSQQLQRARQYADSIGSAAVVVVVDGLILEEWGETAQRFRAHSMRKSLLGALYGVHVGEGHIDLDATMAELGIDDNVPLTDTEKRATIRNLLQGRSGIYIPALYLGGSLDLPPRGSHPPGTYFHYNNWDFNALGTIFEQETGAKIFEEFKLRIADPLQMEDFRAEDGVYWYGSHDDNVNTRYFAYPFRISARDLARFGLLYLRNGRWGDRQVVPAEWIAECFAPYWDFAEMTRYGYTNWKIDLEGKRLPTGSRLAGAMYWTSGIGVHRVYVAPFADLVIVHRVNSDLPGGQPSGDEVDRLVALILHAKIPDLDRALLDAAGAGHASAVEGLLQAGAKVSATDAEDWTALHLAAQRGHARVMQLLLGAGEDVNAVDGSGRTPLMRAVFSGDTAAVRLLLDAGAAIEAGDESYGGGTALMFAAISGYTPVLEALLAAGADVNASGKYDGATPLMFAAARGDTAAVRALLAASADVNAACTNGTTALMLADALDRVAVAEMLVEAGATREAALLPLAAYLPPGYVVGVRRGNLGGSVASRHLLSRCAVIAAGGETALPFAALRGDAVAVRALLDGGAAVNATARDGWTALLLAAATGHTDIVRALLDAGAAVDAQEQMISQTALIWAAKAGHTAIVQILLEGGADVNASDRYGGRALTRAASGGHAAAVRALLEAGADVDAKEKDGDTALLEAAGGGHIETMQLLLDAGADVNTRGETDRTALMLAAAFGREDAVRLLLAAGADVNAQDRLGWTALWVAEKLEQTAVAELLQAAGAEG